MMCCMDYGHLTATEIWKRNGRDLPDCQFWNTRPLLLHVWLWRRELVGLASGGIVSVFWTFISNRTLLTMIKPYKLSYMSSNSCSNWHNQFDTSHIHEEMKMFFSLSRCIRLTCVEMGFCESTIFSLVGS
jgi:hypothetical protein